MKTCDILFTIASSLAKYAVSSRMSSFVVNPRWSSRIAHRFAIAESLPSAAPADPTATGSCNTCSIILRLVSHTRLVELAIKDS